MVTVRMTKHPESALGSVTDSDLEGYGTNYVPRAYGGDGQLHTRKPSPPGVKDIELAPMKYIALALVHLHEQLGSAAKLLEDRSRPVDEYQPQTLIPDVSSSLTVQPAFETNEVIQSIIITGPPGACTAQIGDRVWPLVIPASGIIVIAPIALRIGRNDNRILSAPVAGDYSMELMGYADGRAGIQ